MLVADADGVVRDRPYDCLAAGSVDSLRRLEGFAERRDFEVELQAPDREDERDPTRSPADPG